MASLCHPWFATTNLSYRFPIFETAATALCGTTGMISNIMMLLVFTIIFTVIYIYIYIYIIFTISSWNTIQYSVEYCTLNTIQCNRRKFRSQTSDNMDRWKAEMGRERVRRKKMQSRNTLFLQWFVAPEGRKVGSLKRRVRSQLARWEMKNCTLLWREAHFQGKMYKTHHVRTTFGS